LRRADVAVLAPAAQRARTRREVARRLDPVHQANRLPAVLLDLRLGAGGGAPAPLGEEVPDEAHVARVGVPVAHGDLVEGELPVAPQLLVARAERGRLV